MENAKQKMDEIRDYEKRLEAEQSALRSAQEALNDQKRALYRHVEKELLKNDALYRARDEAIRPLRVLAEKCEQYYSAWYYIDGGEDKEWYSPYPETVDELKPFVATLKEFYNKFCQENVDARAKKAEECTKDFMGATEKEIEAHEKEIARLQYRLEECYTTLKYDSDIILPGTVLDAIQKKMAEVTDPKYNFAPLPHITVDEHGHVHLYSTIEVSLEDDVDADDWVDDLKEVFSDSDFDSVVEELIEQWYTQIFDAMDVEYEICVYPSVNDNDISYDGDMCYNAPDYEDETGYGSRFGGDVYVGTVSAIGVVTLDVEFAKKEKEG